MDDLPFQAEYAKSGRANCKGCKQKIDQGKLRLAIMVQSAFFDGKQANWHHEECFFKKCRVQAVTDISNFTKLRSADKKRIKEIIESNTGIVMPVEKGKGSKKRAAENVAKNNTIKDFAVEYSKSSRATCRHCELKICKNEVRICKIVFDTDVGMKYGGQPLWHHVACFAALKEDLGYLAGGEDLPGFKLLTKEDQKLVKSEIPSISLDDIPLKKLKTEPKDEAEVKQEKDLEKKVEKQDKLFHKHRNALTQYSRSDLQELLEENSQEIPAGTSECLDRLADIMAFGVPEPCPQCKGQLALADYTYKCTGHISEYTKCQYQTRTPQRHPMVVPKGFKGSSAFHKYKPKVGVRVFEAAPPPRPVFLKKEDTVDAPKKSVPNPPLKNLQFFIYGKLKTPKEELKHRILKLGGLVVNKLTETTAAVVSTENDVEKMPKKMQEIQEKDLEVVNEAFLDLIDPEKGTVPNTLDLIKMHNIASWGSDPVKRVPQDVIDGKSVYKSGSLYVKSNKSNTQKLKIKGGTAVDPDSGLADTAHVYCDEDDGSKYTVVMAKTDIVTQKNSYYKLQLLEADNKKQYWLFRAWGRIGTTIGGTKVEPCKSVHDAINRFSDLYMEKTDNPWECRDMSFMKMPGCYCPIEMDYGDEESTKVLEVDSNCKLPLPVQQLVVQIFDIDVMKQTLLEFELDTEKMPLGKLSKKQIKSGYKILTELLKYVEKGTSDDMKIVDATNRFYTTIPHDYGVQNPPLLNTPEVIKKKSEMLENLLEIEIAYSLLKTDEDDETKIPIESHYLRLKADIAPLVRESPEFQLIQQYVRTTHAATHSNYTLDIEQVFKVVREGEERRYKPFRKLHNRRLLWHGSRTTNFAGILSQGLRIAPPEAPVTGYMFGKGIYFADMVSKSANYCYTSQNNPVGCLMLCEVALGDMKECTRAENVTKLPSNLNSVKGIGRTQPDPQHAKTLEDGTIVPLGPYVTNNIDTTLLYNEFIVYDVAQVNVKYLLQMKFNYKY